MEASNICFMHLLQLNRNTCRLKRKHWPLHGHVSTLMSTCWILISFHIHTDHKPHNPLKSTKNLHELPIRTQRFWMQLMRQSFTTSHVAGNNHVTDNTMCRAPVSTSSMQDEKRYHEVEACVSFCLWELTSIRQMHRPNKRISKHRWDLSVTR